MILNHKKPTAKEQKTAQRSVSSLKNIAAVSVSESNLTFHVKGESFEVPRKAVLMFEKVLEEMALGNSVEITSVEKELTTQEAADLLNVSRPHFIKLIESGKIPFRKVGAHRRVKQADILKYESDLKEIRRKGLEFLAKEAQEMGLGY
jgi:excisionase family DNA binding protein